MSFDDGYEKEWSLQTDGRKAAETRSDIISD